MTIPTNRTLLLAPVRAHTLTRNGPPLPLVLAHPHFQSMANLAFAPTSPEVWGLLTAVRGLALLPVGSDVRCAGRNLSFPIAQRFPPNATSCTSFSSFGTPLALPSDFCVQDPRDPTVWGKFVCNSLSQFTITTSASPNCSNPTAVRTLNTSTCNTLDSYTYLTVNCQGKGSTVCFSCLTLHHS